MPLCRRLFLLGGSAAFDAAADVFVPAAGGQDARIALLLQGGETWKKYVPGYVRPWEQRGASQYDLIVPDESSVLDVKQASAILREATGIFIGGGHTPTYHRLYATEPIRGIIRERYQTGVPVAGMSAGALIAPELCALTHDETGKDSLTTLPGLGLIQNVIVGVHFTESNRLPGLLEAMIENRIKTGWGINEGACAVFENEQFKGTLGQSVYQIAMTDFENKSYEMTQSATYLPCER